ncbi:Futalosine hydrolase [Rubripirellula obstinata]|uniref:Futalosine hydrolase n=1 Tax=Rubripirellula obstinata TaxID=406547 RepID=A0A5B1CQU4_9BACT|nr:futalosine hydrolase [Rubripirellula obstinata]KAA1262335.1 Futalosine hydrolase [Rubripirellula obstinata]
MKSTLILVPTPGELDLIREHFPEPTFAFQRVGFGPIVAAARSGALISRYRPSRVLLLGIAGAFDTDQTPVGTACRFDHVKCDGIGVGLGSNFQTAADVGWKQFSADDAMPEVNDGIPLVSTYNPAVPCAGPLLTVCSASASSEERDHRQRRFPGVAAEDMEGFSVAVACSLAGVPLQIIRGISNEVGDRDKANWQVEKALGAAATMAVEILGNEWFPS